jgi:hypothetical protein
MKKTFLKASIGTSLRRDLIIFYFIGALSEDQNLESKHEVEGNRESIET